MKQKEKTLQLREQYKLNEVKKLNEAVEIIKNISTSKFAGSIDTDIVLRLKEKNKKDSLKGSAILPNKVGADKKVIVLCDEADVEKAKKAGAIEAGLESLVTKIEGGWMDFDIVIATPAAMPKIARLGKALGPKGLMPSPKNETITNDFEKVIKSFISGKTNFRMTPDQSTIRIKAATVDMTPEQIKENLIALYKAVMNEAKKLSANPFKKITLSPTMGPSIKLDVSDIIANIS